MTWTTRRRFGGSVVTLGLLLVTAGCGALDVSDPTAIEDTELDNAAGAQLLRGNALGEFSRAFDAQAVATGLFTDEIRYITHGLQVPPVTGYDRREVTDAPVYQAWMEARRSATVALDKLRHYGAPAQAGEMLALRGQAMLALAENFCPGFPSTELIERQVTAGPPLTTAQAFARALADLDTALTLAADSARVLNLVRVSRGAALLEQGEWAAAAVAVADVPTSYTWQAHYAGSVFFSNDLAFIRSATRSPYHTIADHEGDTGLDFVSASDPRLQLVQYDTTDQGVPVYKSGKYPDGAAPIVVASGIEARLIEAEAALATSGDWLGMLNDLRATQVSPALDPLTDPGTDAARVDLLFRERAFWLYATGTRLGDLRRLVRLYGRDPESVFPTGLYHEGGEYGTAISLPFPVEQEAAYNPAVTGCTGP